MPAPVAAAAAARTAGAGAARARAARSGAGTAARQRAAIEAIKAKRPPEPAPEPEPTPEPATPRAPTERAATRSDAPRWLTDQRGAPAAFRIDGIRAANTGGGVVLGALAYVVGLTYLRGGKAEVKRLLRAKFFNKVD